MSVVKVLEAGRVAVTVAENEAAMGSLTAERVAAQITGAVARGKKPVLWLMAAPSAFAFYTSFVERCRADSNLAAIVRDIPIYQFDDYPVARTDPRFPVTFRALLEEYLFSPLAAACGTPGGVLAGVHPLELTGTMADTEIAAAYASEIDLLLEDPNTHVIQVKGIGMDGHWGFHGAETPLGTPRSIIEVPMGSQNTRQQRLDWPQYFTRDEDVPATAFSATVSLFLGADYIIDNVPQPSKQYAVLACYGTGQVANAVPSSALKDHSNAEAVVTRAAAQALLEYRELAASGESRSIPPETLDRLDALWDDPENEPVAAENRKIMHRVLRQLRIITENAAKD